MFLAFLSFFFLSSSHNFLLLVDASSDFHQTWSQASMGDWLQKLLHGLTSKVTQGSHGSKEVISAKLLLLLHMVWSWNSCTWTSSTVSTKLIKLNVNLRSFGVTGSNSEVKFQTTSNGKITNGANMLTLGTTCTKVSTVTSSSDLRFEGQRSKKVKS